MSQSCSARPDDPKLPAHSFDRIFLVHMYHEVESPYAFLWHLRDGLKPDGESSSSMQTGRHVDTDFHRNYCNASLRRWA